MQNLALFEYRTFMMESRNPVFVSIETSAFSGATLLAILLGAHPDITSIGEMRGLIDRANPETYLCSCGKNIMKCVFWEAVANSMHKKGHKFDVANFDTKFHYKGSRIFYDLRHGSSRNYIVDSIRDKIVSYLPGERMQMQRYADRNAAFVKSVLEVTGNNVFVDSSKSRMLLRTFPKYTDFDVRAIHLIRQPEGVVASQLRRSKKSSPEREARSWVKRHRRIELSMRFLQPEKFAIVRYEDLCTDTEATLLRLFEFCGVAPDISKLNYDVTAQHVIGNPMRLRPLSGIELDERWKEELSQDQIDTIQKITRRFGQRYGYEAI